MTGAKGKVQKFAPFLADHNGTAPCFGTKLRWAWEVLKKGFERVQADGPKESKPHG